ncbi:MAG: hypothetical protein J5J00_09525 [Deltaproteobacteria bacterium]|nr:hypothetical protein [Deltaproteobacteria bacterium]
MPLPSFAAIIACAAVLLSAASTHAQFTSSPVNASKLEQTAYNVSGLLVSEFSTGSGAVVHHPNVVVSCAHVVFNEYDPFRPWLSDNLWFQKWHGGFFPNLSLGRPLRGYFALTGYSASARARGLSDVQTFALDFVAHYSYESLANGNFASAWPDGGIALRSSNQKLITGYPAGLYPYDSPKAFLMHATGPFNLAYHRVFDAYYELIGTSTGPGNSGGPVWVFDGSRPLLAGVLVAGLETKTGGLFDISGVRAVEGRSWQAISDAISVLSSENKVAIFPQGASPAIAIYGNTGLITNGDLSPGRFDNTFLGVTAGRSFSLQKSFVVRNEGDLPLQIFGKKVADLSGKDRRYFRISGGDKRVLAPYESTKFKVRFRPGRKKRYSATIALQSNDPNNPIYSFRIAAELK